MIVPLLLCACTQGASTPSVKSSGVLPTAATPSSAKPETTTAQPGTSASVEKQTYQMGPFDLPAGMTTEGMREKPAKMTFKVDEPMWITAFEPKLEDANGEAVPGELLHFAFLGNRNEENPLCQKKETANPFVAATSALKKIVFPTGYGYAVLPSDTLEASVVLHNPTMDAYHDVYFTFKIVGVPMEKGGEIKDLQPLLLDADPCQHLPLAVEPGGYLKRSERFGVPSDGSLIAAYGLLQDYGIEITLAKETEAAPFWKAAASINAEHQVVSLPTFEDLEGIPFQAGDGVVLTVAYQNFSEDWFHDATTAAMVYLDREQQTTATSATAKPYANTKASATSVDVQTTLLGTL
ncbi:MAG: hypothetical protein HYV02_08410 [Deltaproteobacteria bacterium]|nr:hypothetical protein [Deltaproteobacteria bacterium]